MPNLLAFDFQGYFVLLLILTRVSGIIMTAPILGSESVPPIIKIHFSLIITLLVFNLVPPINIDVNRLGSIALLFLVGKELLLGIFIGMIPRILVAAVGFAGDLVSFMMGMSMASIFDPATSQQVQILSVFKNTILILVFLLLNAHYIIFEAIILSFQKVPIGGLKISQNLYDVYLRYIGDLFFIAMKISFPMILVLFLTNVILGFLTKSIPQLNVFIVGIPLTTLLGFLVFLFGIPVMVLVFQQLWDQNLTFLLDVINVIF